MLKEWMKMLSIPLIVSRIQTTCLTHFLFLLGNDTEGWRGPGGGEQGGLTKMGQKSWSFVVN